MPGELDARAQAAQELNAYAEYTLDVLIPQLERLAVPWRFFAWRRLYREIQRRNEYVRAEIDSRSNGL